MALTIKQLNGYASFLLTFEPIETTDVALSTQPFHVLLDPWITSSSSGIHTNFWPTSHAQEACVCSPQDLPVIDLVVISSAKSDHCHEATLRQLPANNFKTRILAEPAAARRIRSWKHFDAAMVEALPRWEDAQDTTPDKEPVVRVPILPRVFGGEPGEMTLTYIGQKREAHRAIGITYRPPTTAPPTVFRRNKATLDLASLSSTCPLQLPTPTLSFSDGSAPQSPVSSTGSGSPPLAPLPLTPTHRRQSNCPVKSYAAWRSLSTLSPHTNDRGVSVIFSPHGIPYSALQNYATTHLMSQAMLPLTALLHCFDSYSQPWFLGGNNSSGMPMPMGQETASALGAKAWVGAHDGDREMRGVVGRLVKKRRYRADEVRQTLDSTFEQINSPNLQKRPGSHPTEVLALAAGEEITMTSEGIWEEDTLFAGDDSPVDIHGLGLGMDELVKGSAMMGTPPAEGMRVNW